MYNKFRAWVLLLIIGAAGLISFLSNYYLVNVYYADWEATTGIVVSTVQTHVRRGPPVPKYHIFYTYNINKIEYESNSTYIGSLPECIKRNEAYEVWYNPENPEESEFLDPKEHTPWIYPLIVGALGCFLYSAPFVFKKKVVVPPNTLYK